MSLDTPIPSPLDTDDAAELARLMTQKYASALNGRSFSITSNTEGEHAHVTVVLKNADESFFYPVEARVAYADEELSLNDAGHFLVNYIDHYFDEYLLEAGEELFIPIDWHSRQWDAVDLEIRGQILNMKLERMADALLAAADVGESESH